MASNISLSLSHMSRLYLGCDDGCSLAQLQPTMFYLILVYEQNNPSRQTNIVVMRRVTFRAYERERERDTATLSVVRRGGFHLSLAPRSFVPHFADKVEFLRAPQPRLTLHWLPRVEIRLFPH